jgi:hypothetical protein
VEVLDPLDDGSFEVLDVRKVSDTFALQRHLELRIMPVGGGRWGILLGTGR